MAAKSDYLEGAIIEHVLRNTAYTSPTTVYLALSTADPTEDGSGMAEPNTGDGYARQAVAFDAHVGGVCANTNIETFGPCTNTPWGTITHFAIFDAATGGNMLYHGTTTNRSVQVNDSYSYSAGNLTVGEQ